MTSGHEIPRRIHVSWKTKDILSNPSPLILNGIRNLADLNPNWELLIYDDFDVDADLGRFLTALDFELIRNRSMVEKIDLWRLLKVYHEGGLYVDIDRYCNIPLDDILEPNTKCVLPTYLDFDFSQDFMMSAPGNPIYEKAIQLNLQRRREGIRNIYFLGPQTYLHAVSELLIGEVVNSDPGIDAFIRLRAAIANIPFIKTYREVPPHDTVIFRYDATSFQTGNGTTKEEFYREYGVVHWTES